MSYAEDFDRFGEEMVIKNCYRGAITNDLWTETEWNNVEDNTRNLFDTAREE